MKTTIGNALTGILVICAVAMTTVAMHREFFATTPPQVSPFGRTRISDGASLAREGQLIGPASAPVKLVTFSDFQCPYCKELDATLRQLRQRHPKDLAVVFRHLPLPFHPAAMAAAIASECAAVQGRFEAFSQLLFDEQQSLTASRLDGIGVRAGIADTAGFRQCRTQADRRMRVERDMATARRLNLTGTPAIVLGDELVTGTMPLDSLEAWIASSHRLAAR